MAQLEQFKWVYDEPKPEEPNPKLKEGVGTAVRVGTGMGAVPTAIRVASGLGAGVANKGLGVGTLIAGILGGGGEVLAQLIENEGDVRKLSPKRVALEAGLSAIPFAKEIKRGTAALKGAGIAATGIVGRKATEQDAEGKSDWKNAIKPGNYGLWDAAQVAGGGVLGAAFGKAKPGVSKVPPSQMSPFERDEMLRSGQKIETPKGPQTPEGVIRSGKWKPEEVEAEILRLEALGKHDEAAELRKLAARTQTGTAKAYETGRQRERQAQTDVRQKETQARTKLRFEQGQDDRATRLGEKTLKADREAQEAAEALRLKEEALASGALPKTSVSETAKAKTATGTTSATTRFVKEEAEEGAAELVDAGPSVGPKAGPDAVLKPFQVLAKNGTVVESFDSQDELLGYLNTVGPERAKYLTIRTPKAATPKVEPAAGAPFNPPKLVIESEKPLAVSTEAPVAPPSDAAAIVKQAEQDAKAKAVAEGKPVLESLFEGPKPPVLPAGEVAPTAPVAAPEAIPAPDLQNRIAEVTQVPEGHELARFFRNHQEEQYAREWNERLTPEQVSAFHPLRALYEAQPRTIEKQTVSPLAEELGKRVNAKQIAKGKTEKVVTDKNYIGKLLDDLRSSYGLPRGAQAAKRPSGLDKATIKPEADELQQQILARSAAQRGTPADVPNNPVAQALEGERKLLEGIPPTTVAHNIEPGQQPLPVAQRLSGPSLGQIRGNVEADEATALTQQRNRPLTPEEQAIADKYPGLIKQGDTSGAAPGDVAETNRLQNELIQRELAKSQGPSGGGGTSAAFLGISPDILEAARNNPEFLTRLASTGAGAGIGAAMSEEDPLSGAILGGSAGMLGAPMISKAMQNMGESGASQLSLGDKLVNWQRFALLSHPYNLLVNTLAPTGGGALGSIEKMAQGAVEKLAGDSTSNMQLGLSGLKNVMNPVRWKNFGQDMDEAQRRLHLEEQRADFTPGDKTFDYVTGIPAQIMTAGDTGVRNTLQDAGWTEDMARAVTVTSEPRYPLTKGLTNFVRTSGPAARFILPFSRTASNVAESSFERIPLVGMLARRSGLDGETELPPFAAEILARQGMGGLVGTLAYQLGQEVDPETSSRYKIPLIVTNLSGQYGAIAGAAFLAGQASQSGSDVSGQMDKVISSGTQALPLPTMESPTEMATDLKDLLINREPPNPGAGNPIAKWVPDPLLPRMFKGNPVQDIEEQFQWIYDQ
jgi:hypothetical protein